MRNQPNVVLVLALILLFPMAICAPSAAAQDNVMEFVIAYPQDMGELNPLYGKSSRTWWYNMLVYDTLLSYDENLTAIPWLAENYGVSEDGLQVTFTLREGAYWHDGQPVTPEDVKFTFELMRDGPSYPLGWVFMQHVTDIEIAGRDIIFTLDQVNSFAADNLGSHYILPKHIREGIDANSSTWDDPTDATSHIGSGMFKYVGRVPDEYTELERFDNWWGPDNPYVGQLPNIERIKIEVILGPEARLLAMRAGDVDTERYEVFGSFISSVLDAPELQLVTGVPSRWEIVLGMNTTIPGLDDFEVRRAIAYAINRDQLVNIGRLGFGTPVMNVIPEAFYPELYHSSGDFPEQNVTIANMILDDAGWTDTDMNGIRDNGAGVELSYELLALSWDDPSVYTGSGIKLQLEEIGFEINLVALSDGPMYEAIFQIPRTYDMFAMGLGLLPEPNHILLRMHSDYDFNWGSNPYGWINSTFDNLLENFVSSTQANLPDAARAAQIAATENMPYIPLYICDDTHALRAEWTNFSTKPGGPFTFFSPETMVFMYDSEMYGSRSGSNIILFLAVGAGAFAAGIFVTYVVLQRQHEE
ncbi:MAG: ABC transporter substrate-binding protein [Promethearchaeota archaeon]